MRERVPTTIRACTVDPRSRTIMFMYGCAVVFHPFMHGYYPFAHSCYPSAHRCRYAVCAPTATIRSRTANYHFMNSYHRQTSMCEHVRSRTANYPFTHCARCGSVHARLAPVLYPCVNGYYPCAHRCDLKNAVSCTDAQPESAGIVVPSPDGLRRDHTWVISVRSCTGGSHTYGRAPSRSGPPDSMASDDDDDDGVRAQPDQVGVEAAPWIVDARARTHSRPTYAPMATICARTARTEINRA